MIISRKKKLFKKVLPTVHYFYLRDIHLLLNKIPRSLFDVKITILFYPFIAS